MMGFDQKFREKIKNKLKQQKKHLILQRQELLKQDPFSDKERTTDNAASDTDAKEESGHDRYQALIDQVDQELDQIEKALLNINNNKFGICTNCKRQISQARLEAVFSSTLCIDCEKNKK